MTNTTPITEIAKETSDLVYRANKVNYKNQIPKLPKKPTPSTMAGYYKRLRNWSNGLFSLEQEVSKHSKRTIKVNHNLLEAYSK